MARVLITGASSGIGEALALAFAGQGDEVLLVARRRARLEALARRIEAGGGRATSVPLDVGDTDRCVETLRRLDREAPLDCVVANAGVGPPTDAAPYSWEALRGPCHVNFSGAAATLTASLPAMVARGRGHLVGISSLSSFGALPGSGAYCAPKAGLAMLLECLRLDVAPRGVAVTTVNLGFVDTPMVAHRHEAMPQLLRPDEAAARIVARLPARPPRLDLPQPLAALTRAAAAVPRPLRDRLVRWAGNGDPRD